MRTLEIEYKYLGGTRSLDGWEAGDLIQIRTILGIGKFDADQHYFYFFDKDGLLQYENQNIIAIRKRSKHLDL